MNIPKHLRAFLREEDGTTSVEYAVMIALILAVCIVSVRAFGDSQTGIWGNTTTQLENVGFM